MIQDIAPHRLDNAFAVKEAKPEHFFFTFHKGKALLQKENEEREMLPRLSQLPGSFETWKEKAVYAFSVDEEPISNRRFLTIWNTRICGSCISPGSGGRRWRA